MDDFDHERLNLLFEDVNKLSRKVMKIERRVTKIMVKNNLEQFLSPTQRQTFILMKAGKSYAEMSQELGISYSAIKARVHNLRKKLRN